MRRPVLVLFALLMLVASSSPALGAPPHASLTALENDLMCTSCRESLALAQSPQAYSERSYLRGLIAKGYDKARIERIMVAQYGTAVLARPPAHGFNLTVYILPPAIVVLGLGLLAIYLPRWRRRSRSGSSGGAGPTINSTDARRLDDELARFGG